MAPSAGEDEKIIVAVDFWIDGTLDPLRPTLETLNPKTLLLEGVSAHRPDVRHGVPIVAPSKPYNLKPSFSKVSPLIDPMYDTEYRELQRRATDLEEPLPDREYEVAWFKPNGRIATDKVIRLDPKPQILPRALDPKP